MTESKSQAEQFAFIAEHYIRWIDEGSFDEDIDLLRCHQLLARLQVAVLSLKIDDPGLDLTETMSEVE